MFNNEHSQCDLLFFVALAKRVVIATVYIL